MANENAKRDENRVTTLLGVTNDVDQEIRRLRVDPTTGRLKVSATFTENFMENPMTTGGDLIYGGASGVPTRLANGTAGYLLTSAGGTLAPTWSPAPSSGQILYECVVASSGGDYTTVGAALAAGKTRIFVRNGTYSESAITNSTNNIMIVGESNQAIISMGANAATFSGTDCYFSNLTVTCSTGSFNTSGIQNVITNCYFRVTGTTNQFFSVTGTDSIIDRNYFLDGAASFSSASARASISSGDRIHFTNNYVYLRQNSYAITSSSASAVISNNTFRRYAANNGNYQVYASGTGTCFTGNTFYNFSTIDKALLFAGAGGTISGNTVLGGARGIDVDNQNITITGNTIDLSGNGLIGIYLQNDRNIVSGNTIRGAGTGTTTWVGIEIIDGRNRNLVSSNRFYNWYDGIKLSGSTSVDNVIQGNYFESIGNKAISDGGIRTNTLSNSGLDFTLSDKRFIKMKNTSGGSVAVGDVVVWKAVANGDEVTTTTTLGDDKVFGMVAEAVADNTYCYVQTLGKTVSLKVDGTTDIAIGDPLTTFTTAKIACKASAGDMVFAYALEAYTGNDSNGVIDAVFITPRLI